MSLAGKLRSSVIIALSVSALGVACTSTESGDDAGVTFPPERRPLDVLVVADTAGSSSFLGAQATGVARLATELAEHHLVWKSDSRLAATYSFVRVTELLDDSLCPRFGKNLPFDGGDVVPLEGGETYVSLDRPDLEPQVRLQVTRARPAGCQLPAYLESSLRALDGRNRGVLRDDSILVVVVLTSAEDCSTKNGQHWDVDSWPTDVRGHVLCHEPHRPDLLHPVLEYVQRVAGLTRGGPIVFAVIGSSAKPTFVDIDGRRAVKPSCEGNVQPTQRMRRFTDEVNKLADPDKRAFFVDGWCAAYSGDYTPYLGLAGDIGRALSSSGSASDR